MCKLYCACLISLKSGNELNWKNKYNTHLYTLELTITTKEFEYAPAISAKSTECISFFKIWDYFNNILKKLNFLTVLFNKHTLYDVIKPEMFITCMYTFLEFGVPGFRKWIASFRFTAHFPHMYDIVTMECCYLQQTFC